MVFNIRNQNAGVINNVEGVQHVYQGQHGSAPNITDVQQAVQQLRSALQSSGLKEDGMVRECLDAIDSEVHRSKPDPTKVADPLTRFTEIAAAAGSLAGLVGPIQTVATWLGTLGQPIARLLGAS